MFCRQMVENNRLRVCELKRHSRNIFSRPETIKIASHEPHPDFSYVSSPDVKNITTLAFVGSKFVETLKFLL